MPIFLLLSLIIAHRRYQNNDKIRNAKYKIETCGSYLSSLDTKFDPDNIFVPVCAGDVPLRTLSCAVNV